MTILDIDITKGNGNIWEFAQEADVHLADFYRRCDLFVCFFNEPPDDFVFHQVTGSNCDCEQQEEGPSTVQ